MVLSYPPPLPATRVLQPTNRPVHIATPARSRRVALLCAAAVLSAPSLGAQGTADPVRPAATLDGGSSATAARDAEGRLVISAVTAAAPVRIDGVLDDPVWHTAPPVTEFLQSEPTEGAPATEQTEVRVAYDAANFYVGAYLHDDDPARIVVSDLRKDFNEQDQDDFEVMLDTYADRRNGYVFITNAKGARADRQIANEGREADASWDAAWVVKTRIVSDGWIAEMAIPLRSLRFDPSSDRWGINFARRIRRKNEITYWSPMPRQFTISRISRAGTLSGLRATATARDLRLKPYVAGRTTRDVGGPAFASTAETGADLKVGVTNSLTLDATVNPDFAQVEADEQQVNLTQFSQFFPEKREFFLENSGIFYVGDAARQRGGPTPTPDEDLLLFHSRRIGIDADERGVPITGGARLTGTVDGLAIGALDLATRPSYGAPGENYAVLRLRQNLYAGSDFGVLVTNRERLGKLAADSIISDSAYNRMAGADLNLRFFGNWDWSSYGVRTATAGIFHGQYAFRSTINHEGTFAHFKTGVLELGDGFEDDLGYYRRTDVRKWLLDTGLRPRPSRAAAIGIREIHPHLTWNYYEDLAGRAVGKNLHTAVTLFFNNGGFTELSANPRYEYITDPFTIYQSTSDSIAIPAGGWAWNEWKWRLETDASRALSGTLETTAGGLWSGTQNSVRASVTARPTYHAHLSVGINRTDASLKSVFLSYGPRTAFVKTLYTARAGYSFTTNMFVDALTQYDPPTRALDANVRFDVIHHPLSDLYIVLNEQRIRTPDAPVPGRSVIVKFTQMMGF